MGARLDHLQEGLGRRPVNMEAALSAGRTCMAIAPPAAKAIRISPATAIILKRAAGHRT